MSEKTIKCGIASFGMSGLVFHGPLLTAHPGFELSKILERTYQKSTEFYPEAKVVRSFDDLISDDELDLIVVNTPDHLHYEMSKKALEAGKHVVVEKPFVLDNEQGQDLIDFADDKGLVLTVFQNRRWDADFLTIKEVVNQQLLGRLVSFEAHYDRFRNYIQEGTWKEEKGKGSILYNLGAHLIDQALVLFGEPEGVTATLGIQRQGGEVPDFFDVWLHYPSVQVTLKASYLVREQGPRYQLHGDMGSFHKYGLDPQEDALKARVMPGSDGWGIEAKADWGLLNSNINGLNFRGKIESKPGDYLAFYQNVYEAIIHKKSLEVKPQEALTVIKVIQAAIRSNDLQRRVSLDD